MPASKKGVKTKLLGVTLRMLNAMLSWRGGGLTLSSFYILLIGSGLFLYIIGAAR